MPFGAEGGVKMSYVIICKLDNGNIIPAFAESFNVAMHIADMFIDGEFTECVEIVKISTGATIKYVF